ncbi:6802_t:CDS:2, partial [Racocetra fulgida]
AIKSITLKRTVSEIKEKQDKDADASADMNAAPMFLDINLENYHILIYVKRGEIEADETEKKQDPNASVTNVRPRVSRLKPANYQ